MNCDAIRNHIIEMQSDFYLAKFEIKHKLIHELCHVVS